LAAGLTVTVGAVGAVVSMLIPVAVFVADVLPAWSVQCADSDWFWPSVETVLVIVAATTPDPESEQFHTSVTELLFQPKLFADGVRLNKIIAGETVSTME